MLAVVAVLDQRCAWIAILRRSTTVLRSNVRMSLAGELLDLVEGAPGAQDNEEG